MADSNSHRVRELVNVAGTPVRWKIEVGCKYIGQRAMPNIGQRVMPNIGQRGWMHRKGTESGTLDRGPGLVGKLCRMQIHWAEGDSVGRGTQGITLTEGDAKHWTEGTH